MRHRYETPGIVLGRSPLGESSAHLTILTLDLGLVRTRAQGVRAQGAKLASALATLVESSLVLVRGKEGWRITGALWRESWMTRLERTDARAAATRLIGLLVRLVAGETRDPRLYALFIGFLSAVSACSEDVVEDVELLATLRLLAVLGLDAGTIPGDSADFSTAILAIVAQERPAYITRVNQGLAASGL